MLVVFQEHVVLGRMLANQVRFENQCFLFAFGDNPFDVPDKGEHERCRTVTVVFAAVEVAAYAVLEHFRLSDVNDFPLGVLHDVNARSVRQFREPPLYMFIYRNHVYKKYKILKYYYSELDLSLYLFHMY